MVTPQSFFTKNMKWIALCLFLLLCFKSIQSCNRNMNITIVQKEYTHIIDSLNKKCNELEKETTATINQLQFELRLQSERAGEANKRAEAVQSVAEKMKANTTINVKGASLDTARKK